MLRARLASSSSGYEPWSRTRAARSPLGDARRRSSSIAASGRVMRRARYGGHERGDARARWPPRRRSGSRRRARAGCVSTSWLSTTHRRVGPDRRQRLGDEHGVAVLAALLRCPASSVCASRSLDVTPSGSASAACGRRGGRVRGEAEQPGRALDDRAVGLDRRRRCRARSRATRATSRRICVARWRRAVRRCQRRRCGTACRTSRARRRRAGACFCRSLVAAFAADCRASAAAASRLSTSTPNAIATIATSSRLRSRLRRTLHGSRGRARYSRR